MANEFVVKNGLITPTVQLPGATSGTVTLSAPAVAGTTAIALPATAGTIVTTGDTGTVTNTMLAGSIANNKLANSTISGTALGGNLPTATFNVSGTGLSGSATYNGTTASTFTVTSNATSANTVSTIVARDASGDFSAGTITAALNGNASTASTLQTARTITLSGDVAGSVSFNGSTNVTITTTIQPDSVALGTDTTGNYMVNVAAGTGVSVSHTQGEGSTATVSIGQPVGTTDNVTFNNVTVNGTLTSDDITSTNISVAGNATITGNLTVSGTTTTVNSTTISIADANIELARNATTAAQANGAGLTVTGPTTAATLTYTSADDSWNFNKALNTTSIVNAGVLTLSGGTANGVLYLNGSKVATSGSSLTFDGSGVLTVGNDSVATVFNAPGDVLQFKVDSNANSGGSPNIQWLSASSELMRLNSTGLGIGTNSPSAPLDIQSNSGGTSIRLRGRAAANASALRYFANDNTTQRARIESNDTGFEINSVANLPIYFLINDSEQMRLTSTGLGIGTNAPAFKLDVNGAVRTTAGTTNGYRLHTNSGITATDNYMNFYTTQASGWAFNNVDDGTFANTRVVITASGNVGIGTTNPDVYGFGGRLLTLQGGASYANLILAGDSNSGIAFGTSSARVGQITVDGTSGMSLYSQGTGNGLTMILNRNGRVGIGTSSPSQILSLQGSSTTYALAETTGTGTSSGFRMKAGASADYTLFTTQGVNQFAIYDNVAASERLTLSSSGNLGIGTTNPTTKLSITDSTGPIVRLIRTSNRFELSADNTFMSLNARDASTYINFLTEDTERVRITSAGNVGIGTTSPSYKLDVYNSATDAGSQIRIKNAYQSASADAIINIDGYGASVLKLWRNGIEEWKLERIVSTDDLQLSAYGGAVSGGAGVGTVQFWDYDTGQVGIGTKTDALPSGARLILKDLTANDGTDFLGIQYRGTNGNHESGIKWYDFRGQLNASIVNNLQNDGVGAQAAHLAFKTSTGGTLSEQVRITSAGNVGIGSSDTGGFKLYVNGSGRFGGAIDNGANTVLSVAPGTILFDAPGVSGGRFTVKGDTGYVGVGIADPLANLHIVNNNTAYDGVSTGGGSGFRMQNSNAGQVLLRADHSTGAPYDGDLAILTQFYNGASYVWKERARFVSSGNVGIGTTNPQAKLQIEGNTLTLNTENNPQAKVLYFRYSDGATVQSDSYLMFNTGGSPQERMRISSGGNVGIGVTAPGTRLDVYGAGNALRLRDGNDYISTTNNQILLSYSTTALYTHAIKTRHHSDDYANAIDFYVWKYGTDAAGTTGTQHVMTLTQGNLGSNLNGAVGIGTTAPRSKLTVNGPTSVGPSGKLSFIGLDINSGGTPTYIKITTTIPSNSGGADFTVNIKGFRYGGADTTDLKICWHWYNNTFYNATISSSGSYAPTVRLSAESGFVAIVLSSPEYWPKLYVESMYSSTYTDAYTTGWTWSDADATGSPIVTLSYKSNFGNNIIANSTGLGVGTSTPSNTKLHIVGDWVSGHSTVKVQGITDDTVGYGFYNTAGSRLGYIAYTGAGFEWYNNANVPMLFYTNTAERMRITSGGNVGIGITSPTVRLQVHAPMNVAATNFKSVVSFNSTDSQAADSGAGITLGGVYTGSSITTFAQIAGVKENSVDGEFGGALTLYTRVNGSVLQERLRITSGGNVGIGTTSPQSQLQVGTKTTSTYGDVSTVFSAGAASASGGITRAATFCNTVAPANGNEVQITFTPGSDYSATGAIGTLIENTANAYSAMRFMTYSGGLTEKMRITGAGKVGIGTTAPSGLLHLSGTNPDIRITATGGTVSYLMLTDNISSGYLLKNNTYNTDNGALAGALYTYTDSNKAFQHIHSGTPLFTILSSGNVGIGTTAPADKLEVNGTARAKKVRSNGVYYVGITGYKNANASAFNMFDISNTGGHQTIEIVLSHHHSGGGQHGSFRRTILALNSYTALVILEDVSTNFGGASGFTITRTNTATIRIGWAGATGFSTDFYFTGWVKGNGDYTITNVGMDSLDAA